MNKRPPVADRTATGGHLFTRGTRAIYKSRDVKRRDIPPEMRLKKQSQNSKKQSTDKRAQNRTEKRFDPYLIFPGTASGGSCPPGSYRGRCTGKREQYRSRTRGTRVPRGVPSGVCLEYPNRLPPNGGRFFRFFFPRSERAACGQGRNRLRQGRPESNSAVKAQSSRAWAISRIRSSIFSMPTEIRSVSS